MDPALSNAEQDKNGYFVVRMKEHFIYSAECLSPAQTGQHSVGLKNDIMWGFLATIVSVRDSQNGLKAQIAQKLHNLAVTFFMQKMYVDETSKVMREITKEEFKPAIQ